MKRVKDKNTPRLVLKLSGILITEKQRQKNEKQNSKNETKTDILDKDTDKQIKSVCVHACKKCSFFVHSEKLQFIFSFFNKQKK